MALNVPSQINSKQAVKFIRKSTKKVLLDNGIASTHSGIKELDRLVGNLSSQPFSNLESATEFGKELGQKIVELSQKLGKKNLDQGVIRQLVAQKAVPAVVQMAKEEPQPSTLSDQGASSPKNSVSVETSNPLETVQTTTESKDASDVEENATSEEPQLATSSIPPNTSDAEDSEEATHQPEMSSPKKVDSASDELTHTDAVDDEDEDDEDDEDEDDEDDKL